MEYTADLESVAETYAGSTPASRTNVVLIFPTFLIIIDFYFSFGMSQMRSRVIGSHISYPLFNVQGSSTLHYAGMVQSADTAVSKTVGYGFKSRFPHQPVWWNGRHTGFKIRWGKPRNSSSLFTGTKQQATQSERRCSHNVSNRRYSNRKR